jgi:site-specific recombinase XerD
LDVAIEHFLASRRAMNVTSSTLATYAQALYRFAREMPKVETVEDIDQWAIREWLAMLQPKVKDVTVKHYYVHLKAFVRFLVKEEVLRSDPFKKVPAPKVEARDVETIPDADFKAMLAACDLQTDIGRRDAAMLMFLYDTGVRVSEMCALKKEHLDLKARQAHVVGKGRKHRVVFFSTHTALGLSRYLTRRRDGSEYVFVGQKRARGGRILPYGVTQRLRVIGRRAKVTSKVNPHAFRHTFATNYLRAGGDPHSLQRILGHADVSTTIRNYAHLVTDDLQAKHEQFSPLTRVMGRRG